MKRPHFPLVFVPLLLGSATLGCSASSPGDTADGSEPGGEGNDGGGERGDGDGDTASGAGGSNIVVEMSGSGGSSNKPPAELVETLPDGFITGPPGIGTITGAYKVLGPLEEYDEPRENSCKNVLRAIIRDFNQSHVDFGSEKPATWGQDPTPLPGLYEGHVLNLLGEERKPSVNPDRTPLDVMESFEDWYVNLEGTNVPYVMDIWLEPDPQNEGTFIFDTTEYFPIDEYVPSDAERQQGVGGLHNFGFTTELHTAFSYEGGEVFNFRGDDDVYVFINGYLAVDLGGIHDAYEGNVSLDAVADAFELEIGQVYNLDLFQAERNPGGSNFRIETSLDFQECGILETDIVVR